MKKLVPLILILFNTHIFADQISCRKIGDLSKAVNIIDNGKDSTLSVSREDENDREISRDVFLIEKIDLNLGFIYSNSSISFEVYPYDEIDVLPLMFSGDYDTLFYGVFKSGLSKEFLGEYFCAQNAHMIVKRKKLIVQKFHTGYLN